MLSLGLRLPLSGSGCYPPASLPPAVDGRVRSQLALLWYSLSPLFCEWTQQFLRLELFVGQFSLFFSLSLWLSQFGLLSHVSSLRLSSGLVLTLRTDDAARTSLPRPCLPVTDASVWATSRLAVAVGAYSVGFPSTPWLCCPLRFQNSPKTCL